MYVCVGCHESQAWACYCPLVTWKFRNSRSTNHETSLCLWGSVAGGKKRDWKVLRRAAVAYTWDAHTHTNTYTHTHEGVYSPSDSGGWEIVRCLYYFLGSFITTCHRGLFINAGGYMLLFVTRLVGHPSGGLEDK
jgi:hypothetical protein